MAKKETNLTLGISEPEIVNEFMNNLQHPLKDVATYLRLVILATNKKIGEGIYWNAPTFFYAGAMQPFNPKDYKRYLVGFNFFKQDAIRLIFLHGASATNKSGLLQGDYKDGRRLAIFNSIDDVKTNEKELKKIIKELVGLME